MPSSKRQRKGGSCGAYREQVRARQSADDPLVVVVEEIELKFGLQNCVYVCVCCSLFGRGWSPELLAAASRFCMSQEKLRHPTFFILFYYTISPHDRLQMAG